MQDHLLIEDRLSERVLIRLDTLIRLRWYATIGQAGAVLVIAFGFEFPMPWIACLLLVGLSALVNIALHVRYKRLHRLPANGTFALLTFDTLQIAVLLYLTGGLQNPFAILLMVPAIVCSTSLTGKHTLMLVTLAFAAITTLTFAHLPLPWQPDVPLYFPFVFIVGVWVADVCTLAFTAIYSFRVAEEARRLMDALIASELVLQREQYLSDLDGLAAAAAHELGTPLSTIAVVSKEMLHALPEGSPMREDAALLRSQADRCRQILQRLKSLSSRGDAIVEKRKVTVLVEEIAAPFRGFDTEIEISSSGDKSNEPDMKRTAGVDYALRNLIDNAVKFAASRVRIELSWTDDEIEIGILDDGRGFPPAILPRLGEPFTPGRRPRKTNAQKGLGLGLFISRTLLQRNGASVAFSNKGLGRNGARVSVCWPGTRVQNASV